MIVIAGVGGDAAPVGRRRRPAHGALQADAPGAAWHAAPYVLAPGPKSLLTLFGAEHGLGGVAGYDLAETTDESPERVATVQHLTWAYLRSQLVPGDPAWRDALATLDSARGRVESK